MAGPKWLENYYGNQFKDLNPEVHLDGEKVAVVKLCNAKASSRFSSFGYVLIQKNGKHGRTPSKSLHEGALTAQDEARIKTIFDKANAAS